MNWLLLKNSLLVSGAAMLLALIAGLWAALCSCAVPGRLRTLILACGAITLVLPLFLVTNSWLHFLGHTGVWRQWIPFNVMSLPGTVWILGLLSWPIPFFLVWSAWQRVDSSLIEADPAITGWIFLRGVLLPVARGPLTLATLLVFVLSLNNFAVPAVLQVKILPDEMWIRFNTLFDAAGVLRLGWPLILIPLVLALLIGSRKIAWPPPGGTLSPGMFRNQLGRAWFAISIICTTAICLLAAALPIVQLLTVKRTWTEFSGARAAGQSAIWNSAWLAIASASVVIVIAFLFFQTVKKVKPIRTYRFTRLKSGDNESARIKEGSRAHMSRILSSSFNFYNLFNSFLWLPFLIPGVLIGIALIAIFNRPGLVVVYQSAAIMIIALVVRYAAIGSTAVRHAVESVDSDLMNSATIGGASKWQILRRIVWPQVAPQISLAWYILFLLCLWDVESTILVVPPGLETMAARVFNLLHYGHNAQINALCLILLLMALSPLLLWITYRSFQKLIFTFNVSRFRQYAIGNTLLVLLLIPCLTACSPTPPGATSLDSQLFSHVQTIGTRGVGVGQLNKPRSVAVDGNDNLFVVDMTGRVQKFSPDGRFLLSWQMPQTDLGKPKGMCRDRKGNILVVEPHYQRVNHFTPDGKLIGQWGRRGTNEGEFILPRAVAVNSQNEILVSEYEAMERVQCFIPNPPSPGLAAPEADRDRFEGGSPTLVASASKSASSLPIASGEGEATRAKFPIIFLRSIGHAGTGRCEFNRPEGICVDGHDRIYVADSCNHRIQIFSPDGKFLRSHGKAGAGLGELSYPYDICVDKSGRQYVCEFGNSRIQVFDSNDRPIEIIGGPGPDPGRFSNPWGVALDSAGNLYVADSQNHRVQKLIRKRTQ